MAMKPLVRIIKRGQKVFEAESAAGATQTRATTETSARDIKTTVSTWVKEFQQRSRTDSRRAFNNLFKDTMTRPSET